MKPVVILGIFNADTSYRAARQPKIGETILGESFALGPGGKGSNQAVAAAMAAGGPDAAAGRKVHLITRLGRDDFAEIARQTWAAGGVVPEVIVDGESHTGAAFIFLEAATGNNAIIVAQGVAARIGQEDIDKNADLIRSAGVFLTQLEQPIAAAHAGLKLAREAGVKTILNPAPAAHLEDDLLALCDLITPNETEAEELTGLPVTNLAEAEAAADALLARGVGAVVITLGGNGALYRDRETSLHVPVIRAGEVAETVGAGDAFSGGLAVALAEGHPIREAMRFAAATAGISVTRKGTAPAMPSRSEIEALLAKHPAG